MTFDTVLAKKMKPLGKWQLLVFFTIIIYGDLPMDMFSQLANLAPPHVCSGPWFSGWSFSEIANFSRRLHLLGRSNASKAQVPDFSCRRFDFSNATFPDIANLSVLEQEQQLTAAFLAHNISLQSCPGSWVYDVENAVYRRSLIESFDLVCQFRSVLPNGVAWYFAGIAAGNLFGGQFGDHFGRRFMMLVTYPLNGALVIGLSFSTSFNIYCLCRFFMGFISSIAYTCGYVFLMEITDEKHRNTLSVTEGFFYSIVGQNVNVAVSYFVQDWRLIHLVAGAIYCTSLVCLFVLPESPKWLVAKGRNKEALVVIRRAIRLNGGSKDDALSVTEADIRVQHEEAGKEKALSPLTAFFTDWAAFLGNAHTLRRLLPMSWLWFTVACLFYSLSYYAVRLPGNPYLIAFLATLLALPPKMLQWFLYDRFDRKRPVIGLCLLSFVVALVGLLCKIFNSAPLVMITAATLVIGVVTAIWDMLYVFASELFPTLHRNKAIGLLSFTSSMGSISGMYIERFDQSYWHFLPLLTYTVFLLFAAICSCLVPPVASSVLMDSYEDLRLPADQENVPITEKAEEEAVI